MRQPTIGRAASRLLRRMYEGGAYRPDPTDPLITPSRYWSVLESLDRLVRHGLVSHTTGTRGKTLYVLTTAGVEFVRARDREKGHTVAFDLPGTKR